jgi:transcriptional regulator with XRE-family HTH domain
VTVIAVLRRTRARSGQSLAAIAARAGIAESNLSTIEHNRRAPRSSTVDRLAEALEITLVPVATGGRNTAADAAEHLAEALDAGDQARAYRTVLQLADDLATATPYLRALLVAEPAPRVEAGWDAFLAAVVELRLEQAGLPSPEWITHTTGDLDHPWSPPEAVLPARPDHVPAAFLRHGVLVEAAELASA